MVITILACNHSYKIQGLGYKEWSGQLSKALLHNEQQKEVLEKGMAVLEHDSDVRSTDWLF